VWRGGDGPNSVSGDDGRGVWHAFVSGQGGGVLDLVVQVRGGSRADALRWAAEFASVPLDERPLADTERKLWAQQKRLLDQELPKARCWRRAAVVLSEDLLDTLKDQFFARSSVVSSMELRSITEMLARLRHLDDAELVTEYRWWLQRHAVLTTSMVCVIEDLEKPFRRAFRRIRDLDSNEFSVGASSECARRMSGGASLRSRKCGAAANRGQA
jgi:hypothetical protein